MQYSRWVRYINQPHTIAMNHIAENARWYAPYLADEVPRPAPMALPRRARVEGAQKNTVSHALNLGPSHIGAVDFGTGDYMP